MKFKILGSGGAMRIPRACCQCKVCLEAREKGFPYKRLGQSLYFYDEQVLFDTPEDINEALNSHDIGEVKRIVYSHWHPDHTMGCRIIEILADGNESKLDVFMPLEKIDVSINENSVFEFYEAMNYCQLNHSDEPILLGNTHIKKIKLENDYAFAFLIQQGGKKVLYCPCHTMHLPISDEIIGCDLFIVCKGESADMEDEFTHYERDTLRIIEAIRPRKTLVTHIEETDGLGFAAYLEMEKALPNIQFAYDGMEIEL